VHRLLLQAITVGAKFTLDHPRSNKSMASFADIPVGKFNQLEVKFLCAIQYDLSVTPSDIAIAEKALQMTTHMQCVEPVQKKMKVVLQDHSNQSSSAYGVAASNNSKENEDNSNAEVESNNSNVSENEVVVLEYYNSKDGTSRMEYSSAEAASNNYNTPKVGPEISTPDLHTDTNNSPVASPDCWSSATGLPDATPKANFNGVPEPTKMLTPEKLGSYTLVATAAE